MPRPEKPIDESGPVAEFAAQLRALREAAGKPTYAELAKRSHYSTTTLSAAASGQRLPTLDVTLAYVRACGGAEAEWTAGWREAAARSGQLPAAEPWQLGGGAPPRSDTSGPAGRHRWRNAAFVAVVLTAAVATAVVVAARVARHNRPHAQTPHPASAASNTPLCPGVASGGVFSGVTAPDSVLARTGPSQDFPVARRYPGNCRLGFAGYCLGQIMRDAWLGTPDQRWYVLPDRTVIASAVINGNPPIDLPPVGCDNDLPGPTIGNLDAPGPAVPVHVLHARATGAAAVGFAAEAAAPDDPRRRWRALAFVAGTGDASTPDVTLVPGTRVVAVACYAADSPSAVFTAAVVSGDADHPLQPLPPSAVDDSPAARYAACRRPHELSPQQ